MERKTRLTPQFLNLKISTQISAMDPLSCIENHPSFHDIYRIVSIIGEGGHCAVYLAESKKDNQQYAVKQFRTNDEEFLNTIRRTFQIQQMTNDCNHFVMTYDLFTDDTKGIHHLVTEYSSLKTLYQIIGSHLDIGIQKRIIRNLSDAVSILHSKRISHRDIKPDNILVNPLSGEIKLIDFGVAKIFGKQSTEMMTPTGHPEYRAPEVGEKIFYDEKIDVYGIGLVAYQMMINKKRVGKIDLSLITNTKENMYCGLITQMLEKDPLKRISASQIVQILDQDLRQRAKLEDNSYSLDVRSKSIDSTTSPCRDSPYRSPARKRLTCVNMNHSQSVFSSMDSKDFRSIKMGLTSSIRSQRDLTYNVGKSKFQNMDPDSSPDLSLDGGLKPWIKRK